MRADRARLAEALSLFASEAAAATGSGQPLVVTTTRRPGAGVEITIAPNAEAGDHSKAAAGDEPAADQGANGGARREDHPAGGVILARRLISIQGGSTADEAGAYLIRLRES